VSRTLRRVMLVLAVIGLVSLARRSRAVAVCLAAPLVLGIVAAYLGKYPLADRTLLFAVPCVWLPAAVGVEVIRRQVFGRWPVAGLLVPAVLLAPGLVHMGKFLIAPRPNPAFREAFAFVEQRRQAGDALWVSHAEVYKVYHGPGAPVLDAGAVDQLDGVARRGRLWMVSGIAPAVKGAGKAADQPQPPPPGADTHLRAQETSEHLVCRRLVEKKKYTSLFIISSLIIT